MWTGFVTSLHGTSVCSWLWGRCERWEHGRHSVGQRRRAGASSAAPLLADLDHQWWPCGPLLPHPVRLAAVLLNNDKLDHHILVIIIVVIIIVVIIIIIIIMKLVYLEQFDTSSILIVLYIVIKYIRMRCTHICMDIHVQIYTFMHTTVLVHMYKHTNKHPLFSLVDFSCFSYKV